ncbi:MAG: 4a-hydroxytetrahydrobiopterin dehydratase [Opitutaceae bacterium]|nr:4a-hydroxytetrahydrobiopterin dehydratase [Opitutaceae bacterium]|tara:strand:+ start:91 stop:381 length:291 start_codon:yes stop_codon:yes gene_type:complete
MSEIMKIEEITDELQKLNDWEIIDVGSIPRLMKVYSFKNFAEALEFTNQVGILAEEENHHPEIITEWGKTTVTWWTHSAGGLSPNDFAMAAKVDQI